MRALDTIIVHYSATPAKRPVTVEEIRRWHKARKPPFKDIGYHFVVQRDGTVETGRPLAKVGAHVTGHNKRTVGVCYVGGLVNGKGADTRTPKQREAVYRLCRDLIAAYGPMKVLGHRDLGATECPGYDVAPDWAAWLTAKNVADIERVEPDRPPLTVTGRPVPPPRRIE